jgi:hypothetical protein
MSPSDRGRLRIAAGRALRAYPGAVGEVLAKELHSWEAQSLPLGVKMNLVIEKIMNTKLP